MVPLDQNPAAFCFRVQTSFSHLGDKIQMIPNKLVWFATQTAAPGSVFSPTAAHYYSWRGAPLPTGGQGGDAKRGGLVLGLGGLVLWGWGGVGGGATTD